MPYHLDTDFLVLALSSAGPERNRLLQLAESEAEIQISAIVWYEFARGPRTPEQLAVARSLFFEDGIIPFSEEIATLSAMSSEVSVRRVGAQPILPSVSPQLPWVRSF
jgi:predicted nucleic acid-binding protein